MHTADGGATWVPQSADVDQLKLEFVDVVALSPTSAIALGSFGSSSHMVRTSDAGQTWVQVPDFCCAKLVEFSFVSATTGWVLSEDGHIFHTEDGGRSWTLERSEKATMYAMTFLKQ